MKPRKAFQLGGSDVEDMFHPVVELDIRLARCRMLLHLFIRSATHIQRNSGLDEFQLVILIENVRKLTA